METPVLKSFSCSFSELFSLELCESFKNTHFEEHLQVVVSEILVSFNLFNLIIIRPYYFD